MASILHTFYSFLDRPQITSANTIFYAAPGMSVTLYITVRAFPLIMNTSYAWRKSSGSNITYGVSDNHLGNDEYYSQLVIDPVTSGDYTTYIVSIDNGIQGAIQFDLKLKQRGNHSSKFCNYTSFVLFTFVLLFSIFCDFYTLYQYLLKKYSNEIHLTSNLCTMVCL